MPPQSGGALSVRRTRLPQPRRNATRAMSRNSRRRHGPGRLSGLAVPQFQIPDRDATSAPHPLTDVSYLLTLPSNLQKQSPVRALDRGQEFEDQYENAQTHSRE